MKTLIAGVLAAMVAGSGVTVSPGARDDVDKYDRILRSVCAPPSASTATATAAGPDTSTYYASCAAARAAGVTPLREGDPGYRAGLDRDHDGVACE